MKEKFNSLNFLKLNYCFFLINLPVGVIFNAITTVVNGGNIKSFLTFSLMFFIINLACFYRLNNGLIALLCKKFGSKVFRKKSQVNLLINNSEVIAEKTADWSESVIVTKSSDAVFYQILKLDKAFYIRSCKDCNDVLSVAEFSAVPKKSKNDITMFYSDIESVTIKTEDSKKVICIKLKKKYHYFTLLFDVADDKLSEFFKSCGKRVTFASPNSVKRKKRIDRDEAKFIVNVFNSAICILFCQIVMIIYFDKIANNFWNFVCCILLAIAFLADMILPYIKAKFYYTVNSGKPNGTEIPIFPLLFGLFIVLLNIKVAGVISFTKFIVITAVLFAVLCIIILPKVSQQKGKTFEKYAYAVLALIVVSTAFVFLVNNSVVLKKGPPLRYKVVSLDHYTSRGVDNYMATVKVDEKTVSINVPYDDYIHKITNIEAVRYTGLLGLESIAQVK